jgi:pyruvate dehydrogenase E1 component alpha subunit
MIRMQRQGRIGTYGPGLGQEAAMMTAAFWLRPTDWLVPSFREGAAMFHRGWSMDTIMLWWGGHEEGCIPPEGVNDLPIQVPVAAQTQTASGLAYACKYKKDGGVVACYCGDGGTSEGDFHEAMNFSAVLDLPIVFVIQNNHWAISLPRHRQTKSATIAQKAIAYGIDGIQVDGNDVLATTAAGREAIDKARNGGGPTLIEAVTYRLGVHTTADDPKKYRKDEEVELWKGKDPMLRFATYLKKKKIASEKDLKAIDEMIEQEIKVAIERTEQRSKTDPRDMFKYTYAEMTPALRRQLAEFEEVWQLDGRGSASGESARQPA